MSWVGYGWRLKGFEWTGEEKERRQGVGREEKICDQEEAEGHGGKLKWYG